MGHYFGALVEAVRRKRSKVEQGQWRRRGVLGRCLAGLRQYVSNEKKVRSTREGRSAGVKRKVLEGLRRNAKLNVAGRLVRSIQERRWKYSLLLRWMAAQNSRVRQRLEECGIASQVLRQELHSLMEGVHDEEEDKMNLYDKLEYYLHEVSNLEGVRQQDLDRLAEYEKQIIDCNIVKQELLANQDELLCELQSKEDQLKQKDQQIRQLLSNLKSVSSRASTPMYRQNETTGTHPSCSILDSINSDYFFKQKSLIDRMLSHRTQI